jgi:pyruvate,orthophosphate dikinase
MCDTEFTIEQGKLWMLQTRVGKRTGAAALKMAVDMTKGSGKAGRKWKISKDEALLRVAADHFDQVLHPQFATKGKALAKVTDDERFAYDSYRRFISMYGRIVLNIDGAQFDHPLEQAKEHAGVKSDAELTAEQLGQLCELYKTVVKSATGKPFPQDPTKQLRGAVEAVFKSWNGARAIAYRVRERIDHMLGTAVNVQTMVFGNRDDNSGTGVGFTRNAATGENRPYGDFLVNAQGEDVVAGIRNTEDLDAL